MHLVHTSIEKLSCGFLTLVIRNDSLNRLYAGGLKGFMSNNPSRCNEGGIGNVGHVKILNHNPCGVPPLPGLPIFYQSLINYLPINVINGTLCLWVLTYPPYIQRP